MKRTLSNLWKIAKVWLKDLRYLIRDWWDNDDDHSGRFSKA